MKVLYNVLVAAIVSVGVFSVVVYTSCKKDKCDNVVCQNQGACDGGICYCPTGYEGIRCEELTRDRFVATYNGNDSCSRYSEGQYPIYFTTVPEKPLELMMKNLLNSLDDSAIATIQSLDSFVFNGANNSTTYRGYGVMRNDSLWLTYHVDHDTTSYDCVYFGQSRR